MDNYDKAMMNYNKMCKKIHNRLAKTGEMDEKSFKICCEALKEYAGKRKDMFTALIKNPETKFGILFKFFGSALIASIFKKLSNDEIFKIAFGDDVVIA